MYKLNISKTGECEDNIEFYATQSEIKALYDTFSKQFYTYIKNKLLYDILSKNIHELNSKFFLLYFRSSIDTFFCWENIEVSDKLTDIKVEIKDLMYSIYQMENKIVNSIDNLTYVTQDSFRELNMSVNNQLSSIDSSIKFNNLLTGIQTYQMYRINQNTKGIG